MTPDNLLQILTNLTHQVIQDSRWHHEHDDLGVTVFGFILYGYGLSTGRMALFLDLEDIHMTIKQCLTTNLGTAEKWTDGLIEAAAQSAFNPMYHPGHHELIEVGQQYMGETNLDLLTNNIFENIKNIRQRIRKTS